MFTTILFSMLAMSSVDAAAVKRAVNPGFDVQKVRGQMMNLAGHSWEWGTAAQALLELDSPALSVFGNPFPIPSNPSSTALDYARGHIFLGGQYLVPSDGKFRRWRGCFMVATDGYICRCDRRPCVPWSLCSAHWKNGPSIFGRCRKTEKLSFSSTKMEKWRN